MLWIKLTRLNQEYARFNKAMGFKSRAERLQAIGWNRSMAAKSYLAKSKNSATLNTISGARITNSESPAAKAHAERYYGLVRSMKTDVAKISENTGIPKEIIQEIKEFIFLEKHDLGGKELEYFAPDFAMAQSWQRSILGKPEPHDMTLLRHEILEKEFMQKGATQGEAHKQASRIYNYAKESDEYYAALEKYSDWATDK